MIMENVIVVLILLGIAAAIVYYLYKSKKRGQTCIGCPYSKQCAGKCGVKCSGCCNNGHSDIESGKD